MAEPVSPYAVRPAMPADAVGLAHAHRQAWREAYGGLMPDTVIEAFDEGDLADRWRVRLEVDEPDGVVVVGVAPDGEVVGFASAGPTRDADAPTEWELYAVNIVGAAYGSGLAQELVRQSTGARPVTVWVLLDNARARAFYAKEGFVEEGGRQVHADSGLPEMRMIRRAVVP